MNFFTSFKNNLKLDKPFIIKTNGKIITYSKSLDLAGKFSQFFKNSGLKKGDRVLVCLEKNPESLFIYIACLRGGFVLVPVNPAYTRNELDYFVCNSTPKLIITNPDNYQKFSDIESDIDFKIETLSVDGTSGTLIDKVQVINVDFDDVDCDGDDLAAIMYTSGTTGRSKGAMISHDNLFYNTKVLCETWKFSSSDILLHTLPIFHVHGLFVATNVTLYANASLLFLPKFDVDQVINFIPKASIMMGIPTYYTLLLQDDRLTKELTRNIRLFTSGSAPLLSEKNYKWNERTGKVIVERYGTTETGMITSNPCDGLCVPGTVGFPLSGVSVRVTSQISGHQLSVGEIGSIEVKGKNVFQGYWNMPKKTKEEIRGDGFFITGDIGFFDNKGYLHIIGRQKDVIITCGLNVYPKEVEEKIDEIKGVVESAVIGVPHSEFGEAVIGVIVLEKNANITEESIINNLKGVLVKYKIPIKIYFVNNIPKNALGKFQKNILRSNFTKI